MNVFEDTLTPQEMFDHCVIDFTLMTRQSNNNGHCAYRGFRGAKCIVGRMMTDYEAEGLDEQFNTSVRSLAQDGALPTRFLPHVELLSSMQEIHDEPRNWKEKDGVRKLQVGAALFNVSTQKCLDVTVLKEKFPSVAL